MKQRRKTEDMILYQYKRIGSGRHMRYVSGKEKFRAWRILMTLMLLACMLLGLGASQAFAQEDIQTGSNMLDGSKIEGVKVVWVSRDSTVNNEGQAVSQQELDDTDHLYLATNGHGELSMVYKIEVQFSGQYDYGPGDITITIPAQVWRSRTYEQTGVEGETAGIVEEGSLIGKLELPVPQAPSTRADFNWQLIDGNYVLTNTRTIGATSSVSIEVSIHGLQPIDIVDMSESLPITAHCEVVTNLGNTIELTSTPITAQIDTIAKITGVHKDGELYEDRPTGLSDEMLQRLPEGTSPDDYLYIRWYSYHSHEINQPYSLDIEDTLYDAYRMVDGQKVKVTDGIFLGSSNYEGTIYPTEDDTQVDFAAEVVDHEKSNSNGYQYSRTVYVWSAYRKADFYVPKATEPQIVYYFENKIDWHLTETDKATEEDAWAKPADEQKVTTASDKAVLSYAPVQWQRPTGAFSVDKWTEEVGSKDWTYGYALNKLENGVDVDMNYIVRTTGYGYPWTTPQTGEFNYNELSGAAENVLLDEMELDQNLMGTLGWQQITDDFQTFFNFENTPLTAEDFQFKSLRVGTPHKKRYGKTAAGKWQYITDSTLPNPDLVIEFQLDGGSEWIHAATATWGEGGKGSLTFVDVNEGAGVKISGSSVIFPENVTDTRHSFISNVFGGKTADKCDIAMIRWDVYPTITMKASPRVQKIVAQMFENTESPSTKFKNDVIMDVYGWVDAKGEGKLVLDNDFDYSRATFAGASYGVHLSKTVSFNPASKENGGDNDTENQWAVLHYTAVATEQSNLKVRADYDEALAEGVIPAETSGIWYDLLPEGVVPLLETVKLRSGDAITNMYTVPDYNGTGRILLVVEADLTPVPTYTNYVGYADKPTLSFDAIYSWKDADELGSRVVNYVAFESTVDNLRHNVLGTLSGSKGENDTPLSGNNKTTPNMPADIAKALTDLDPNTDEGRFVYGRADVNIAKLNYAVSGLEKRVQNDLVGIWTQGLSNQEQVTVYEGHNYTYRLNVSSAANTYTANIIIYDTLENYIIPNPEDEEQYDVTKAEDYAHTQERLDWAGDWQGKGQWRGTLTSVDLKDFIDAGVAPRLYYATLPGLQFADTDADITDDNFQDDTGLFNSGNYDLENEVWTLAQLDENGVWQVPEGVQVSAVAMDATLKADGTPFILQPECDMTAYLHMRAPDDESDEDVWHAKGAYARLMDDHGQAVLDEKGRPVIDWEAALDPANNMYAYNNTRMKCTQALSNIVSTDFRMIRNDYTRVGIVPEMVKVTKEWQDQDNHDGIRPDSVEVTLLRRLAGIAGEAQTVTDAKGQPLTAVLSEENDWTHSFLQVDIVNEDGIRYLYSFEETQVDGYTSQIVFVDDHHYLVRNTHPNEQVEISGQKEWKDNEDALELRPDSITVYLLRDGVKIDSRLVRPDSRGNWSYSFGKRDKYAPGGVEYTYTVEESYVPKYVAESTGYTLLENTYVPYGDLEISKTLVNATQAAADREFTFTLVLLAEKTGDAQDAVPLMESYPCSVMEEVNGEWQAVSAGKITSGDTFTLRDGQKLLVEGLPSESTYEVTEAEEPGFTCAAKNNKGTIRAGQTAEAAFTNTYASSGVLQLSAGKSMTGHAIRKNQFRFEIVDMNEDSTTYGQPIRTAAVNAPENTEGGVGEEILSEAELFFGQLQYATEDDGKTFRYEVREKNQEKDGYTYDDTVYTVDVTVSDNGDGTMTVTPVFTNQKTGLTADALTFENHYDAQGEVTLKAWKTLEGRALEDGEFTFQLYQYDAESNTLGELISEVTNDAQGNIVFPPLSFDQNSVSLDDAAPATYTYLIREKRGADRTVEYSNQEYVITLSVFDNGDGTLSFAQGTQEAERTVVDCATCAGTGAEYLVIYSMPQWFVDGGSSAVGVHRADTAEKLAQVKDKLCKQCGGFSADNPSVCDRCKGCGLEESYYENGTYVRTRTEGVCVFNGKGSYAAIRLAKDIRRCTDCEGIGKELGGMTITGEVVAPVFENTLKPGELSVTKTVQGSGSTNVDQEFTFHVKLSGEVENDYEFTVSGPAATPAPERVAYVNTANQKHFTEEQLQGQAYGVVNLDESHEDYGKLIFFRSDPENPVDPYGNAIDLTQGDGYRYKDEEKKVIHYLLDEGANVVTNGYTSRRPWNQDSKAITSIYVKDPIKPLDGNNFFRYMYYAESMDLRNMDTSGMTNMEMMFAECGGIYSLDLSSFDTSNVRDMSWMFYRCYDLDNPNLSSFDTTSVTDMSYMFYWYQHGDKLDLSSFDTRNVTTMYSMFEQCQCLRYLDISNFNTGKVTSMGCMFYRAHDLVELDLSHFDTSSVTSVFYMFAYNWDLKVLDISSFTQFGGMFAPGTRIENIQTITINDNTKLTSYPVYSGNWINVEDDTELTGSELFTLGGNGGTWVRSLECYKLVFDPGEGAGSMSNMRVQVGKGCTITPTFYRYGYDLTGFADDNGTVYPYENGAVVIPANNGYQLNQQVTLTAQWQKRDTGVTVTGDGFTFTLKRNETATFENLPAGTVYEVWEETPEGWVLVKTENDAGTIEPLKDSAAKFTNRYAPDEAQVILRAAKRLDGKAPKDGVYQFTLSGEGMETQEKSSVSGAVVFDAILYTEPGMYIYTISEKAGQDDTIEYDSRSYTAEVTVTDNAKGVLSAAVVYKDSEGNALADAPSFENTTKPGHLLVKKTVLNTTEASKQQAFTLQVTFASQGTSWSGTILRDGEPVQVADGTVEVEIRGGQTVMLSDIPAGLNYTVKETGTLPGWTMDGTVQEGTILSNDTVEAAFENTYALKGTAVIEARKALIGRTMEAEEFRFEMMDEAGRPVSSAVNGADGKITFPEITYTEEGTWHYTIHEAAGEDDSISYSEEVLAVTVEMTDVEGEGRLTATVTYDENGDTITNEVKKGSLTISKEVISPNADHRQKQFTFTISLTDALGQPLNGVYALNTGDELMVQNGTGTLQIAHGQTVEISGLPHGANYSVTEAAEPGFTHTARNAAHVIDADAPAHASFVNTYHAQGEYIFDGVKTLLGAELEENKFQFELKDGEGYTLETVKNGADGSFAFSTLYFTEEDVGEKQFTVTEVNDGVNGYAYDDTRYTLTLTIADNGDGTLSVTAADMPESGIAFENTYSEETSVQAQKRWVGDEAHPQTRCDVKLVLYAQAGGKDREKVGEKVISADAQGDEMTVVWENLPLFLIEEGQRLDILYSLEEEMLTENGQPLLYKGIISGNAESGFEVINRYASVEVVLEAEKVLTGRTLQESQFLFEVRDESGVVVNATNASDGSITFPALRYIQQDMQDAQAQPDGTLQKTFTYQVAEADGGVNGYVYDDTVYQVQVTVTQHASGEMTAQVTLDAEKMVFRNTVEKTSFSVTKEWQGDEGGLITLTLYQNGEKMEPQPAYTENGGVYTYTDLDKYTEEGKAIVYAAKEKYMDGFMTIYRNMAPYAQETDMIYNGGTIVNRAVTTFRVQKVWEGLSEGEEAPEITLTLYCNGEALDKKTPTPDADGWYIYHNLPLTRNGEAAVYTVVEEPLDGFQASYGEAEEGEEAPACAYDYGTIVNRKIPKTNDNSHIGLWIGLTVLSAGMLAMLWKKRRKV